jgi:hypothetical protein
MNTYKLLGWRDGLQYHAHQITFPVTVTGRYTEYGDFLLQVPTKSETGEIEYKDMSVWWFKVEENG